MERRITQQQIVILKRLFVIIARRRAIWLKFVVEDKHGQLKKKHGRKQLGRGANWVQTDPKVSNEDSDTDFPLYQLSSKASHSITVDLKVNKKKLTMEIDT